MGYSVNWYEIRCDVHGTQEAGCENWKPRHVTVGTPHNKRQKYREKCPRCMSEVREKEKQT